jgi:hypothetical protein
MADSLYTQLTDQGIVIPDTSTLQTTVEGEFVNVFGGDIDLSPETPQGRLVEEIVSERAAVLGICAANASQLNPDYATGLFLDAIGSSFNVLRIGATSTRVICLCEGDAGTVIPAGSKAKTTAGDIFYAENSITLPAAGGSYFLSVETGAIPCVFETLTTIVDAVLGWNSIIDTSAAAIGLEQESDGVYRTRIKASRYSGTGFISDVASNLQDVSGILSSFAYDNGESTPVDYDGITIAGNSVVVVADGGTDSDIAQAVFEAKSGGCGYTAIAGAGTVTFSTANPSDTETVTVGGQVYMFKNTMSAAYDVQIGAAYTDTAVNLNAAIMASGTEGVEYFAGTLKNLTVTSTETGAVVTLAGGRYGTVLCSDTATNVASAVTKVPLTVVQSVTDPSYGVAYPVTFNRPEELRTVVDISVRSGSYSGTDLETAVKNAIVSWSIGDVSQVDGLKIGIDVSPYEIASAVTILVPAPYVTECKIQWYGVGSLAATTLEVESFQVARVASADITVNLV